MTATPPTAGRSEHFRALVIGAQLALAFACAIVVTPRQAFAQESSGVSATHVLSRVVLDPTTYVPTLIAYRTTMRDWDTSQVFFQHGYVERNDRFTTSGLPNDVAVGYSEGRRRILNDALLTLGASAAQNAASRAAEDYLAGRFPQHKRLVKTIGWVQRCTFASYVSYHLSITHYRQTQYNVALARSSGYR